VSSDDIPAEAETPDIEFRGVSKNFGDVVAVDNIDLTIPRGGFVSFLGPSGCGKTTFLRMIAGFEQPDAGEITLRGRSVVGVPAHKRPVNMVFQHYALFPHLNVADNVGYGVKQLNRRISKKDLAKEVGDVLEMVRLPGFEDRQIWEMSGGQQQRVALARALINRPNVLLLDEPLAALDRKLRRDMQIELQNLQREVGITFILVTHDQEEALSMSDTVCLMKEGSIVQTGSPQELYKEPLSPYVADFVGKSNFFGGVSVAPDSGPGGAVKLTCGRVVEGRAPRGAKLPAKSTAAVICVRPEVIQIGESGTEFAGAQAINFTGNIINRIFLGEHTEYVVRTGELGDVLVLASRLAEAEAGIFQTNQEVTIGWTKQATLIFAKKPGTLSTQANPTQPGEKL
jgi:spermidine/putrescine transport system ATP-binding protein